MAWVRVALLLALALIAPACGDGGTADPTPTARVTPIASRAPDATPATGGLVGTVTATDGSGDLLNDDDQPVSGHGDIDVVGFEASADGEDLAFTIRLAVAPPATVSTIAAEYTYVIVVEVDGDSFGDYWIALENRESGEWSPNLFDVRQALSYYDERFRGSVVLVDELVLGRVPLTSLGSPDGASVCVITQLAEHATGSVLAEDNAPDGSCLGAGPLLPLMP